MESRPSRRRSSSRSISRSRSPISDDEQAPASPPSKRGPSTPSKPVVPRNDTDEESDHTDRKVSIVNDDSQAKANETPSPMMSDTDQNRSKKRSHHRHHHHRHQKESKSNKRSAPHHRHTVKRSKKESVPAKRENKSDDEKSITSPEKPTSESEHSQSEQEVLSSGEQSKDEEGAVEESGTPNERPTRRHHKKRRSSSASMNERDSQSPESSAPAIPKNNRGTQLIVNYLPASLREADFYQLFARIAPIKLCKLITDRHTGHSFCYGFIEYHKKEEAVKAIEKFNGYRIEHKKLKVSYAQPKANNNDEGDDVKHSSSSTSSSAMKKNPNIYITDLPDSFTEKMLERLFSKYGEIVQTKVLRDPRTKISRGVAFVLMTSTRYAERAVKALDGYVPSGARTPISVKYADPKKTAAATSSANNGNHSSSARVSMPPTIGSYGYPPGLPSMGMMDPYYAAAFHHHHHRAAMNMRDLSQSPPPPPPSYYGGGSSRSSRARGSSPGLPRSYSSSSSKHTSNALSASMNNPSSRSSSINPSLPTNLNTAPTLAAACDLISKGCQQAIDPNGFVIYAFGLPHDCNENDLEELFQRYGDVYRVYIVRNYTTGESKGYSFVTMRHYDEACHAVDRLDGSTFQGRTIQVRFKQ